jgi:hypothetical protein
MGVALVALLSSLFALVPNGAQGWTVDGECLNGNQEMAYDAEHGLVCRGIPASGLVILHDLDTGIETTIDVGYAPTSMDISANGSLLYVAVCERKAIAVIDLEHRILSAFIELSQAPDSVCEWRPDLLLFSGLHDGEVYYYNLTTATEGWLRGIGTRSCLQASPDHTDLLIFELGYNGGGFYRFQQGPEGLVEMARATYGTTFMAQMAVDWQNGSVYVSSTLDGTVRDYAISDLSITRSTTMSGPSTGMIFIPERQLLLCTMAAGDGNGTEAVALSVSELNQVGRIHLVGTGPYLWMPAQQKVMDVYTGVFMPLAPGTLQLSPSNGEVLAYGPGRAVVTGELGLGSVDDLNVTAELDGSPIQWDRMAFPKIWLNLPDGMADGNHTIHVRVENVMGSSESNCTFTVDRSLPGPRPTAVPLTPGNGTVIHDYPSDLAFDITYPDAWVYCTFSVVLNGNPCYTAIGLDGHIHLHYFAAQDGWNRGSITLSYDGQTVSYPWEFRIAIGFDVGQVFPSEYSLLTQGPTTIWAWFYYAPDSDPALYLDGVRLQSSWPNATTISASFSSPLSDGDHVVRIASEAQPGNEYSWTFTVVRMLDHNYSGHLAIRLPQSWEVQENVEIEGARMAYVAKGAIVGNFQTNIVVQVGRDNAAREDESYLLDLVNDTIKSVLDKGMDVQLVGAPYFVTVSGHMGVCFNVSWAAGFRQMIEVVVSESDHMSCNIIYSVSGSAAGWNEALFHEVGQSVVMTATSDPVNGPEVIIYALAGVCIVIAVASVFLWRRRER